MPTLKKRVCFFESEEGLQVLHALQSMTSDITYCTEPSYSSNAVRYPDNLISFVDKHMNYLNSHPTLDPDQYVSNLRLITRIR